MKAFISFVVLFITWLLWSGFYDPFHLLLGIISTGIVVAWTGELFTETTTPMSVRVRQWIRLEWYVVWLLWQIVLANLHVFKLAVHPRMLTEIDPQMVTFTSQLSGDVPLVLLAHSITLTPGTVAVNIDGSSFQVHALTTVAAKGVPGEMDARVHHVFEGAA